MRFTVFSLLFLCFGLTANAQFSINVSFSDISAEAVWPVEVYNKTTGEKFVLKQSPSVISVPENKAYDFTFYAEDFGTVDMTLSPSEKVVEVKFLKVELLSEVVIQKQREKLFALNKLRDVEETAIYAGKKTEVVSVDQLTVNKAVNNTRQVYSQVVGLTINEGSDGGLQLSVGGRGLNPNRTSNFNTRQNGYDISADVLGYPESYYTPPVEALQEIQVVRGAASLQYGTQFGGLINFKLHDPSTKKMEIVLRNTLGSYGLYTNFSSLSGTVGKFSYYTYFNYKQGDGFRPNSEFSSRNFFANLNYAFSEKTSIHFDYTNLNYLAQQPGGLTDLMFNQDPEQSNRARNWFDVHWNLFAFQLKHKFSSNDNFSLQLFGLDAQRQAVGYRQNRVSADDVPGSNRDLISGKFANWGAEARYLRKYKIGSQNNALLLGAKYYQAHNREFQGAGSTGSGPDFELADDAMTQYTYPNLNLAIFGENVFRISDKFSITPGFRYESIRTKANGFYRNVLYDLAGNVILDETINEKIDKKREIFLFGIGMAHKMDNGFELYGNVSRNYRSVTYNDIRTSTPGLAIDPGIDDEKGYTSDVGIRGKFNDKISLDASVFALYYGEKIGEYLAENPNGAAGLVRYRTNVGNALTYGFEAMVDWKLDRTFFDSPDFSWNVFANGALTGSEYLDSDAGNIEGNKVEFVPLVNVKTGTGVGYRNVLATIQLTYYSDQFTDASNSKSDPNDNTYGVFGQIPSYYVADLGLSYKWRNWKLESGINNFTNNNYFTRRATGYPGPGIIPSETRTFYVTLEVVF
ncbi:TonB-dependent receptor [Flavobacterium sp. MAH-1]|uniref:TonB-dependent receptor n=1 Tax=Flavobacterium agri TaxID=2743471 RepID=A0A7Y8Y3Y0_9FLAO|nr:TonB-dependent receptor [Flavobacterium agri]NUY82048.1 TonB-dependent receptor [Flavobacterium agri]NYA72072.1 TonB-dependent receptor [Flavobacterium agri]